MLPQSFLSKKKRILEQLAIPAAEYDDLSPKGSIDENIRDLIDEINSLEGCVTTSSCGGRISVFLEGKRSTSSGEELSDRLQETVAKIGGKGGGGRWLFVSHDPVTVTNGEGECAELLGLRGSHSNEKNGICRIGDTERRLIHFKFEPMILHLLTSSLSQAQTVLSAALQSGFRESGALNLNPSAQSEPATPMVAVRSMGLALESIIGVASGDEMVAITPESQLRMLVEISNERFVENAKRIERFKGLLKELSCGKISVEVKRRGQEGDEWEDADARRERKKREGLMRAEEARKSRVQAGSEPCTIPDIQSSDI